MNDVIQLGAETVTLECHFGVTHKCKFQLVLTKLMGLDQLQAKFLLKSDLNNLLIDFFNPIPAARFTRRDDWIQIRTIIR